MNCKIWGISLLLAAFMGMSANANAQSTLASVRERGMLRCGVEASGMPGFMYLDGTGVWQGFNVDVCRGLAAGIFGDPEKVQFVGVTPVTRFAILQSGEVDLLSNNTTLTYAREVGVGVAFAPPVYYDGHGMMVRKSLKISTALDLNGATVCIPAGSLSELNAQEFFRRNELEFTPIIIENVSQLLQTYRSGRCDALFYDRSSLAAFRLQSEDPDEEVILPETVSRSPLAPVVRQGDAQWANLVRWTVYLLIAAEEKNVTSANVDEKVRDSRDPEVMRYLGVTEGFGSGFGLPDKWGYHVIRSVGNYGEIFDRNLGADTPMKLERGYNALWRNGGLHYPPPM